MPAAYEPSACTPAVLVRKRTFAWLGTRIAPVVVRRRRLSLLIVHRPASTAYLFGLLQELSLPESIALCCSRVDGSAANLSLVSDELKKRQRRSSQGADHEYERRDAFA